MVLVSTLRCRPGPAEQQPWGWGRAHGTAVASVFRVTLSLGPLYPQVLRQQRLFLQEGGMAASSHRPGDKGTRHPHVRRRLGNVSPSLLSTHTQLVSP